MSYVCQCPGAPSLPTWNICFVGFVIGWNFLSDLHRHLSLLSGSPQGPSTQPSLLSAKIALSSLPDILIPGQHTYSFFRIGAIGFESCGQPYFGSGSKTTSFFQAPWSRTSRAVSSLRASCIVHDATSVSEIETSL